MENNVIMPQEAREISKRVAIENIPNHIFDAIKNASLTGSTIVGVDITGERSVIETQIRGLEALGYNIDCGFKGFDSGSVYVVINW